jgi:hypothetical protein
MSPTVNKWSLSAFVVVDGATALTVDAATVLDVGGSTVVSLDGVVVVVGLAGGD